MKTIRIPAVIYGLLYLGFLTCVALTYGQLPERVATHFNAKGQANGWMSRSSHLWFTLIFGFCFPLIPVALSWIIRFLPGDLINIPRREYWLAPERRNELSVFLFRQGLWFSCLGVCFVAGVYFLILRANLQGGERLSMRWMLWLTGGFLAALVLWIVVLLRHFWRADGLGKTDRSGRAGHG